MPTTSKTQICNMALAHVGVNSRIEDVDTESTEEANACRLWYDHAVDTLLEMQRWSFATRQVDLQDLSDSNPPPDEWGFRYMYPNTCKLALRIVNPAMRVDPPGFKIPFKIVDLETGLGKSILCDQENAILEYNHEVTEPAQFPATFVQALSLFLATLICMPLKVDAKITQYVNGAWSAWQNEAGKHSLREGAEDRQAESEFVLARG